MIVTRNAIIISCPGSGENYLRGANKDLQNVYNYLTSPRGGAWKEHEIFALDNPVWSEVKKLLSECIADYQFIYFAGHGCSGDEKRRFLAFKDQEIEDIKLLNHNPRQLIIADACRIYYPTISGIPPAEDIYSYFSGETEARRVFDDCIRKSANGKIIIHATQHNTEAKEERYGRGGAFTLSLLHTALNHRTGRDLSPVAVFDLLSTVKKTLLNQGYSQIPDIPYIQGNLQVPFLIDTEQMQIESEPEQILTEPQNGLSFLKVLAFALILITAVKAFKD